MSKDGINQNSLKVRLKDLFPIRGGNMFFLTKMVLVAVLLSGLISISSYTSFANATTNATTNDTNKIITGDTEELRMFQRSGTYDATVRCWHGYQSNARHI